AAVRGTRASRDEADAWTPGQLAVGLRHVRRRAFVLGHDRGDLRCVVQRVEHVEVTLSGDTEQAVHAVDAKRIDQDPTARPASVGTLHLNFEFRLCASYTQSGSRCRNRGRADPARACRSSIPSCLQMAADTRLPPWAGSR